MPIRLNLLAELQAAEELPRRDPAKRALLVSVALIFMVLVWISSLQVKIMADNSHLSSLEATLHSHTNEYAKVMQAKKDLSGVQERLLALNHLAAERFLESPLLDGLMHSTVDGIQITRFHTDQNFDVLPEIHAPSEHGRPGVITRPASSVERVKLVLDARDSSPVPGSQQITKFKEALAQNPYFVAAQISTNSIQLKNMSSPQLDAESGKPFVLFTLECSYPEKSR